MPTPVLWLMIFACAALQLHAHRRQPVRQVISLLPLGIITDYLLACDQTIPNPLHFPQQHLTTPISNAIFGFCVYYGLFAHHLNRSKINTQKQP